MAKKVRGAGRKPVSFKLVAGVETARELVEEGLLVDARDLLLSLRERYPPNQAVLGDLANVCLSLGDAEGCLTAIEDLSEVRSDDPEVAANLAAAYVKDRRFALALAAFGDFLDRWPDHPRAADAREAMPALVRAVEPALDDLGLAGGEGIEAAALNEMSQRLLVRGEYDEARAVAEELLRLRPGYEPALNNIALSWLVEGRLDEAAEATRRVLDADADNLHALANLVHVLVLSGELDAAREAGERLARVDRPATDAFLKKAEAFSWLGDDEAVLAAFAAAEASGTLAGTPHGEAQLLHFAAVAAARFGRDEVARGYWRRALAAAPGFEPALANLDEMTGPPEERHAPWPFGFHAWMPAETFERFAARMKAAARRGEREIREALRGFLASEPRFWALIPALLDRGDRAGRELAVRLAIGAATPDMLEALVAFARSRRGPDALRAEAANDAHREGLLAPGLMRFWSGGAWSELLLVGFEVHDEQVTRHRPAVERLARDSSEAIYAKDGATAERLLTRALELEPDAPDLLFNLSLAFRVQSRDVEADALVRHIHFLHPDYLFARTALADIAVLDGRVDEARALLAPLYERPRIHRSELAALAGATMAVHTADGRPEQARAWLDMLRQTYPAHPAVAYWERTLATRTGRGQ